MRPALLNPLFAPVTSLSGVGPKQDRLLRYLLDREETPRLVDLLLHLPASVIDRRARPKIRDAMPGTVVTLEVTVDRHRPTPARNPRAPHLVYASDETGDVVLTYFRAQPGYVEKLLPVGSKRYVSGTAQMYDGTLQLTHPDRVVDEARFAKLSGIDPVYPLTEGLALGSLRRAMAQALQRLPALPEWISPELLRRCKFPPIAEALNRVHVPRELTDILPDGPFWSRLAFDELLAGQLALALVRAQLRRPAGDRHAGDGHLRKKIIDALPYALTASQRQAAAAITDDLRQPVRMLRLLQGDVGSGKTVVALLAAAAVTEVGKQAALMAPTEILARQHIKTIAPLAERAVPLSRLDEVIDGVGRALKSGKRAYWICPLVEESEAEGIEHLTNATKRFESLRKRFGDAVGLVHGQMKGAEKDRVMAQFASGEIGILVATTVVEVGVEVPAASIMVIENAERFGLAQLHQLRGRIGRGPEAWTC